MPSADSIRNTTYPTSSTLTSQRCQNIATFPAANLAFFPYSRYMLVSIFGKSKIKNLTRLEVEEWFVQLTGQWWIGTLA